MRRPRDNRRRSSDSTRRRVTSSRPSGRRSMEPASRAAHRADASRRCRAPSGLVVRDDGRAGVGRVFPPSSFRLPRDPAQSAARATPNVRMAPQLSVHGRCCSIASYMHRRDAAGARAAALPPDRRRLRLPARRRQHRRPRRRLPLEPPGSRRSRTRRRMRAVDLFQVRHAGLRRRSRQRSGASRRLHGHVPAPAAVRAAGTVDDAAASRSSCRRCRARSGVDRREQRRTASRRRCRSSSTADRTGERQPARGVAHDAAGRRAGACSSSTRPDRSKQP